VKKYVQARGQAVADTWQLDLLRRGGMVLQHTSNDDRLGGIYSCLSTDSNCDSKRVDVIVPETCVSTVSFRPSVQTSHASQPKKDRLTNRHKPKENFSAFSESEISKIVNTQSKWYSTYSGSMDGQRGLRGEEQLVGGSMGRFNRRFEAMGGSKTRSVDWMNIGEAGFESTFEGHKGIEGNKESEIKVVCRSS